MSTSVWRLSEAEDIVRRKEETMNDNPEQWACEAYGPEGIDIGALCFFAEQDQRACISRAMCSLSMNAERNRVHDRIRELAARGDPVGAYLAQEFTSPDQILNSSYASGSAKGSPLNGSATTGDST